MDQSPQVKLNSTAHYFLEGLNEIGIEYLFCNLGTDHAPLIEEMARWRKRGAAFPRTILCPHENVAVHMAAGYAMMTGRGQGVLVHVDAGTANSAMAMHDLYRARTPVLLAGQSLARTPWGLGAFFRRMRAKLGAPAAITATAHTLARIIYPLLTTRDPYDASRLAAAEAEHRRRTESRLRAQARALGFQLVPAAELAVS